MTQERQNIKLVPANNLKRIAVSDSPPNTNPVIYYLTPEQFSEKFGFTYDESLYGPSEARALSKDAEFRQKLGRENKKKDVPHESAILERLRNPLDCFVISKISGEKEDESGVGYGLFTLEDIPRGTVLGIYSGTIGPAGVYEEKNPDDYCSQWGILSNSTHVISSKEQGGLARFMQHLPFCRIAYGNKLQNAFKKKFIPAALAASGISQEKIEAGIQKLFDTHIPKANDLEKVQFSSQALRSQLATENVHIVSMFLHGVLITTFSAAYDIHKNHMLGYRYGEKYWLSSKKEPRYFTQLGALIGRDQYQTQEPVSPPAAPLYQEAPKITPQYTANHTHCFFPVAGERKAYLESLRDTVGKKEIQFKENKKGVLQAYFSTDWLKQVASYPGPGKEELEEKAGISSTFLNAL